jgi:hypothetical protein
MPLRNDMARAGAVLALGLCAWMILAAGPAAAQLRISEVLGDPDSDWNGDGEVDWKLDEWVEVLNRGSVTVDLADYWLRDILGDEPHLQLSGQLAPGEAAVFYGSDAVAWQEANNIAQSGLSLNNGGDGLYLLVADPDEPGSFVVVDGRIYNDHEAEGDRAWGYLADGETLVLFDALNPYDGTTPPLGTGCDPTPGYPNPCDPGTPVEAASWSGVKARFD